MIYTIYRNHLDKTMNHTEVIHKARTFSECNNDHRNSDPSDNRSKETLRESVHIRSFSWYVFSCNRTEYQDLLHKSPYSVQMQESTNQKKTPYLDNFLAVKWCVYVWENSHVEERYNFHIKWLYFFAKHGGKYNK